MVAFDNHVASNVNRVRRFFVQELAQRLYECTDNPTTPRDKVDWSCADTHTDLCLDSQTTLDLTRKFLVLSAYSELRKTRSDLPFVNFFDIGTSSIFQHRKEVERAASVVDRLSNEEFDVLFNSVGYDQRQEYMRQFLGRDVWEIGYQTIRRREDFLKDHGYTRIRFG